MIASCVGLKFASSKERCWGCAYLSLVLLALLLQSLLVVVAMGGSLADINNMQEGLISANTTEAATQKLDNGKRIAIKETLKTFTDTFSNTDTANLNKECTLHYTLSGSTLLTAYAAEADALPWLRRGASSAPSRKLALSTKNKCVTQEVQVVCTKDLKYAQALTDYCQGATSEDTFKDVCSGCVEKFWTLWELNKTFTDEQTAERDKLYALYQGDAGAAYCRCLSGFIAYVDAYYPTIKMAGFGFLLLEVLVLVSTIYLMFCGPEGDKRNMDLTQSQIEMSAAASKIQFETVECPQKCGPGDPIMVTTQAGQNVQVTVPEGVYPGMMFNVEISPF